MQMLLYKMHLIRPDENLQRYGLENGCCVDLSVKGVGGGGDTDTGMAYHSIITILMCASSDYYLYIQTVILNCLMSAFRVENMHTSTVMNANHLGVHHVMNSGISIQKENIIKPKYAQWLAY